MWQLKLTAHHGLSRTKASFKLLLYDAYALAGLGQAVAHDKGCSRA